jgi:hypothetical protein
MTRVVGQAWGARDVRPLSPRPPIWRDDARIMRYRSIGACAAANGYPNDFSRLTPRPGLRWSDVGGGRQRREQGRALRHDDPFWRVAGEVGCALGYAHPHELDHRVSAYQQVVRRWPRQPPLEPLCRARLPA